MAGPKKIARWRIAKRQHEDLLTHLCALRQIEADALEPDFEKRLHDPYLLPDMEKAVGLILQAKKDKLRVTIFGDYDADGTPAAALLSSVLTRIGVINQTILPTRAQGYGLNPELVRRVASESEVLLTVDNGITAVEETKLAKELGLKVIVLDHHLPKDELPPADAVVDPFVSQSKYPFSYLCGCALAFKLTNALAREFPNELTEGYQKWLLDLVAISTVADMMHMTGENRTLVHYGLKVLRKTRRPGLRALMEAAGLDPSNVSASALGYTIGPRLNASGRIADNRLAYDLLMTESLDEAKRLSAELEKTNRQRQALVEDILIKANAVLFEQNSEDDHLFIVYGQDWPGGVLGLVAGKLAAKHSRPVIALALSGQSLSGSARSVGDYSIIDGLASQTELLSRYGGHRQAAGLGLEQSSLEKFVDGIKAHAKTNISPEDLSPLYEVDAILGSADLALTTAETCERLEPFGLQNPQPLFVLEDVTLGKPRLLGSKGNHLKWQAHKDGVLLDVIGFGMAEVFTADPVERGHLLGYLETNRWNGQTKLQFRLVDYKQPTEKLGVDG